MPQIKQNKTDLQDKIKISETEASSGTSPIASNTNKKTEKENTEATPMIKQFLGIKKNYTDHLLLYRMGDFYELFFDDAIIAAKELDIVLTRRGKQAGEDIAMCGVPHHSFEVYLKRLIKKGYKVAICEQIETPEQAKKRAGYKAVVKREVTRVVTPATVTEENLLEDNLNNYLLAISFDKKNEKFSLAFCDISTGDFKVSTTGLNSLLSEVERLDAKEIIIPDSLLSEETLRDFVKSNTKKLTSFADDLFKKKSAEEKIKNFFEISSLDGFVNLSDSEISSCGAIIEYLNITQIERKPRLNPPKKQSNSDFLELDKTTIDSLEIFRTQSGEKGSSLFNCLNSCKTAGGARTLYNRLSKPLISKKEVEENLEGVEFFIKNQEFLSDINHTLSKIPDIERIISRIYINRSTPKDLSSLKDGLGEILSLNAKFYFDKKIEIPDVLQSANSNIKNFDDLYLLLREAISEYPPINLNEGGIIRDGFHPKLDDYRNAKGKSEKKKTELLQKYIEQTGINNLRIKTNNVIGTFIEINPSQANKSPDFFIHRQTLASSVRYTTDELRKIENELINSDSYAISLEIEIYHNLRNEIIKRANELIEVYKNISKIDLLANFSSQAIEHNYTKPELSEKKILKIEQGRHPVIERNLEKNSSDSQGFCPNDIDHNEKINNWLITGPNMSGKSTFLRQNALIVIMAQAGCYVPAKSATIGITDKIFSRVGASDNIAKGHSTFMVEMIETASILNNATERSFVILDEIGRGTATFDGLSIAWAALEHIHDNIRCRCLFASHYHELTTLEKKLKNLTCYKTDIKEWNDQIIFMHKIVAGKAMNSYGIFVGELAGLPNSVVSRSKEILKILENNNKNNSSEVLSSDLPLFTESKQSNEEQITENQEKKGNLASDKDLKIIEKLKNIDLNSITPIEALNILSELKDAS